MRRLLGEVLVKNFLAVLVFGGIVLVADVVSAATEPVARPRAFYLLPTLGGYSFDGASGLGSAVLYGLKIGYDFAGSGGADALGVEGFASAMRPEGSGEVYQFRMDAIYPLFSKLKLTPFLALGGGWIYLDGNAVAADAPIVALGFGVKYALEDHLLLRADFRNVLHFESGRPNNLEYTIGLTYLLGRRTGKPDLPVESSNESEPLLQGTPDSPDGRARRNRRPAIDAVEEPSGQCPYPLQEGRGEGK